MSWFIYMVRCADNSLYTGITTDLDRRLDEHNGVGKGGAKYTKTRRPVTLVYQEACENRAAASAREYQLKKLNRNQKLALAQSINNV